ncbi:ATP-dependent RNA helicase dbp3 [Hyaloscypha bicolor E]|uniref:RNA helicase n=1 Tax=Hyaloscypha bicolor E TaxID=1095630 RepID=A0A2J6T1U0_9HELO|nr:ATP-dependent RNA helicase dbp3 [Hyaloscypha bicolor E]PMD56992.1 ATP-dependent RNA helicase dbp3 [Hyaloscypha bicolor E]
MPKLKIEDAGLASGEQALRETSPASRKSRKESKKTMEEQLVEITQSPVEDGEVGSRAARKERKRLKKLKKLQDETVMDSESSKNGSGQVDATTAKAARKAEKARLKASKRSDKEGHTNGDTTLQTRPLSTAMKATSLPYTQDPGLSAIPQADIDQFLADNFISITDPLPSSSALRPLTEFSYLPVTDPAQRAPFKTFKAPTPIQAAAWPFLFAGRDVIGVAETGSGKTMAFAVPCVRGILSLPESQRNNGPRAVIVSPTRELAMQSYEQIMQLAKVSGLRAVCVYGGVPKDEQRKSLKTADIVVATPGRLNDLINEGCADLSKAKYVVLDEADRMLDKGFEEEIRKIINTTPAIGERQTLMFTATWPESVRSLASTFMSDPVKISIGDNPSGDLRANARIMQQVEVVDPRNKEYRLLQLLKQYQSGSQKDDRILVFALYKKEATRIEGFIRSKGFRVAGIHGDLSQEQRTRSLDAFKQGNTPILVATDVAARGLDIPSVKLVINCTFPLTTEDYVHRIGRTGRAGKEGLAITLFTEHDKAQSGALINVLKAANQPVPDELLKFGTTVKRKEHEAYGAFARDVDRTVTAKKIRFE